MTPNRYQSRRRKLAKVLRQQKLDALLITDESNVTWLTGFRGDSSYLLLGGDTEQLLSDSRYTTQIAEECPGLDAVIRPVQEKMHAAVARLIADQKYHSVGVEAASMTIAQWQQLRDALPDADVVPQSDPHVQELRTVKDADEVAAIREAARLARRGFDILRASITPEMTELQAAHLLEHAMRGFGAEGTSFPPIVAVGDRAALPHYRPSDRKLGEAGFVLVDWGARADSGYVSDLTRVLITGRVPAKLEKIYEVVRDAGRAAIAEIRPGATCSEIDAVSRSHIERAGYGKNFGHGLGHGIGLDVHEQPRLSPISEQTLAAGMVVTVEPGIYLPGWGGVRIEEDVLVTREGCEVLSESVPSAFDEMQVG